MHTLARVIGKTPSEIPFEELLERIKKERHRAIHEIQLFKKGGKQTSYEREVSILMKKAGISGEQLQELIRKTKEVEK